MAGDPHPIQLPLPIARERGRPSEPRLLDLFAGIGGTRLGLEGAGLVCVFACEADRHAARTYSANFSPVDAADIRDVSGRDLPVVDLMAAGLPAASFSSAGVSKLHSLGRPDGFRDARTGGLFFEVVRLIGEAHTPPPVVLLDSVKGLLRHDRGATFGVVISALEELGYNLAYRVIDAQPWVPQHRERLFIVGLHRDAFGDRRFSFPKDVPGPPWPTMGSVLERGPVDPKYTLPPGLWAYLQAYAAKHKAAGSGFGFGLVDRNSVARTLSARYYKDGSEILVRTQGPTPRRLTPRECARLMGFPDSFVIPVSDTQAYRQFGNAMVVPLMENLGRALVRQTRDTGPPNRSAS